MASPPPNRAGAREPAWCRCGLFAAGPWELVAHLLEVWPPGAGYPREYGHEDTTPLRFRMRGGPTEAWQVTAWACETRKYARAAAAIAHRAATGDLAPGTVITAAAVGRDYGVSPYTASHALSLLHHAGITGRHDGRPCIRDRALVDQANELHHPGQLTALIIRHVVRLEGRAHDHVSYLPARPATEPGRDR